MRYFILALLLNSIIFAGTYNYEYSVTQEIKKNDVETKDLDPFMYGDFEEIVRFDMLWCDDMNITNFEYITKTIKEYIQDGKNIKIKIIGHTSKPTDDHNELVVDSDTYANTIQNAFRFKLDTNTSKSLSKDYALNIQQKLIDNEINKEITYVEYRSGDDIGFTDATTKGRDLSNRVMVTMYVEKQMDSDNDGVFDTFDKCPNTPENVTVDKDGCPEDNDNDGVYDYLDKCLNTPLGLKVDEDGCQIRTSLGLLFKTDSDVILEESYFKVIEYAEFLKENPLFDVLITGHTDSVASEKYNFTLSQKRAESTKKALISEGIDSARLTIKGEGELKPIDTNDTKEGRQNNRRIEATLSLKE